VDRRPGALKGRIVMSDDFDYFDGKLLVWRR
jgi:hypothetical protein